MHRVWEFDVKEILHNMNNTLQVVLHSPNQWIRKAHKKYGNLGNDDTFEGFMHLRKAHYMFGWDWGAHLPDAGIFRPVSLPGINKGRIDNVYIRQEHERTGETEEGTVRPVVKSVTLTFRVEVQNGAEDLVLSDNYFDLSADEKRVKILAGSTENLRVRSVYDIR